MQEVPFSSLFAYIPKSQLPSMYGVPLEAYQLTIALKQGRENRQVDHRFTYKFELRSFYRPFWPRCRDGPGTWTRA